MQLSKAYFRRAGALSALGREEKAVACYRACARHRLNDPALLHALTAAVQALPLQWLTQAMTHSHTVLPLMLAMN